MTIDLGNTNSSKKSEKRKSKDKGKKTKKSKKTRKKKSSGENVNRFYNETESELIEEMLKVNEFPKNINYPFEDMFHKTTIVFYGDPKAGKTTTAMGAPGTYLCLGFEAETNLDLIKQNMYGGHDRFQIKNFKPFISKDDEDETKSSSKIVYDIAMSILNNYYSKRIRPDWVLGDGMDVFKEICEMRMRESENLGAYEGPKNRNVWKKRNSLMDNFYNRCLTVAKRGAIFTSQNIIQETDSGTKKVPAWLSQLRGESVTEVEVRSKMRHNKLKGEKIRYVFAEVKSCKLSHNEGEYDVTFIENQEGDGFETSPKNLFNKIINPVNFKKVDGNKMYGR